MRVIVVTIEPPDPFGNPASRWFYVLLNGLVAAGHSVTMISSCTDLQSRERAEKLFPKPKFDLQCFANGIHRGPLGKLRTAWQPFSYVFSTELRRALERECDRGFDVLHLEHLWSGWIGWRHAERSLLNVHYLFSSDFADTAPTDHYDRLRRAATYRAEARILKHYPHVAALTERLTGDIRKIAPQCRPRVLPLGIDSSLYPFSADDPSGPRTIGVIGNFSWAPTYRAGVRLHSVLWPRIKAAVPDARLLIVGRDALRRLGDLPPSPDVEVLENVPEIIPYFQRLHVLLNAPSRGSGTKVKVQESMALGIPVVTNADGGEGIPGIDGEHWGLADSDDGLVERAIALLNDAPLRRQRRIAARALLEREFGAARTVGKVLEAYASIARPNASPISTSERSTTEASG